MKNYMYPTIVLGSVILLVVSLTMVNSSNHAKKNATRKSFDDKQWANEGTTFGGGSSTKKHKLYKYKSKKYKSKK